MARLVILEQPQHLLHARDVQRVAALERLQLQRARRRLAAAPALPARPQLLQVGLPRVRSPPGLTSSTCHIRKPGYNPPCPCHLMRPCHQLKQVIWHR